MNLINLFPHPVHLLAHTGKVEIIRPSGHVAKIKVNQRGVMRVPFSEELEFTESSIQIDKDNVPLVECMPVDILLLRTTDEAFWSIEAILASGYPCLVPEEVAITASFLKHTLRDRMVWPMHPQSDFGDVRSCSLHASSSCIRYRGLGCIDGMMTAHHSSVFTKGKSI